VIPSLCPQTLRLSPRAQNIPGLRGTVAHGTQQALLPVPLASFQAVYTAGANPGNGLCLQWSWQAQPPQHRSGHKCGARLSPTPRRGQGTYLCPWGEALVAAVTKPSFSRPVQSHGRAVTCQSTTCTALSSPDLGSSSPPPHAKEVPGWLNPQTKPKPAFPPQSPHFCSGLDH
jgi:hypothetical protein